jgi:trk system potassium uptake protein TrkH
MGINPARLIILSFLTVILLGCFLLLLPISTTQGISFIDALFTATSATCVTGLIVKDTPHDFTTFGQTVIMLLFQLGGLGIMTFSTIFALVIGRRVTVQNRKVLSVVYDNLQVDVKMLLKWILAFTVLIEGLGFILLYLHFKSQGPFFSLFHAISAFCNAGFSLISNSFQNYRDNLYVNLSMTFLIITGGLGFWALYDLLRALKAKIKRAEFRVALHTKIVIFVSLCLIILGMLSILGLEYNHILSGLNLKTKILTSYFQSVTARTAGFNTLDINSLNPATKLLLCVLMFIGASPGSTGGGIKTVTFALVVMGVIAILKGKNQVRIFNRAIPLELFEKAIVIFILGLVWICLALFLLLISDSQEPLSLIFEVFSAFGTVGLSTGITPYLTPLGKFIIILTMFLGRIGPMTLAIALTKRAQGEFRLPEEKVMVG